MGVRSFLFAFLLIAVTIELLASHSPNKSLHKKHKRRLHKKGKSHFSHKKFHSPRSEFDLERRYDAADCAFPDKEIRTLSGRQMMIECGVHHNAQEYKVLSTLDYLGCLAECAGDVKCVALAWNPTFSLEGKPYCGLQEELVERVRRGARHPGWIGAKVVGGSVVVPTPTTPTPTVCQVGLISSSSANARGLKCNTPLRGTPSAYVGAIPKTDMTSCFNKAQPFDWDVLVDAGSECLYYKGTPPDLSASPGGSGQTLNSFEKSCWDYCGPAPALPVKECDPIARERTDAAHYSNPFCNRPYTLPVPGPSWVYKQTGVSIDDCSAVQIRNGYAWFGYNSNERTCTHYNVAPTTATDGDSWIDVQWNADCFKPLDPCQLPCPRELSTAEGAARGLSCHIPITRFDYPSSQMGKDGSYRSALQCAEEAIEEGFRDWTVMTFNYEGICWFYGRSFEQVVRRLGEGAEVENWGSERQCFVDECTNGPLPPVPTFE
ncbi:hypothetical protein B0J11DRAFT_187672 [Dendryphion nanum]|uniref:Apple domain-containing protein n=1 Tax=Dendryphion nanum TaxID=256645 RepID=A0A9P9I9S7_9PLEO|nr:hypothetical protein B0J11DRAFT_187672 [Dendryphion nanum]